MKDNSVIICSDTLPCSQIAIGDALLSLLMQLDELMAEKLLLAYLSVINPTDFQSYDVAFTRSALKKILNKHELKTTEIEKVKKALTRSYNWNFVDAQGNKLSYDVNLFFYCGFQQDATGEVDIFHMCMVENRVVKELFYELHHYVQFMHSFILSLGNNKNDWRTLQLFLYVKKKIDMKYHAEWTTDVDQIRTILGCDSKGLRNNDLLRIIDTAIAYINSNSAVNVCCTARYNGRSHQIKCFCFQARINKEHKKNTYLHPTDFETIEQYFSYVESLSPAHQLECKYLEDKSRTENAKKAIRQAIELDLKDRFSSDEIQIIVASINRYYNNLGQINEEYNEEISGFTLADLVSILNEKYQ